MNELLPTTAPFRDPLRPPTPPKEHTSDPLSDIKPNRTVPTRTSLYTPEESPSSSAELDGASSFATRKRVKISGLTSYHHIPTGSVKGYDSDELRTLPRSRDCKSTKSILKLKKDAAADASRQEQPILDDASIESMLKSANRHLSTDARSSSLDAYSNLSACLSTYDTLDSKSDGTDIHVKEMAQYLRRDISRRSPVDSSADTHLVTPALRIVILFVASAEFSAFLPDDFKTFVVERSISSLDNADTPKIILAQYMHILEKQKFGPKVMTAERTHRLLSSLDKLEKHARSPRIAAHRLMICRRLLQQAKPVMVARVLIWLPHLFNGLLSSVKDIRLRAISLGLEAGMQLGSSSVVARACTEILQRKNRQDEPLIKRLHERSIKMVNALEDPDQVPQIWSVLILLLRNYRSKIEAWDHFPLWKETVGLCLKSTHIQTFHQAHLAINRLIFVINVDTMSSAMADFLKDVVVTQLSHTPAQMSSEKKVAISKHLARSTYCILLYACFHPTASHTNLDRYWDIYVDGILSRHLVTSKSNSGFSCDVLSSLFSYQGAPRIWNERQAVTTGPVLPTEILNLDPRWVRSRAEKVAGTLRHFSRSVAWFKNGERATSVFRAWQHFLMAIETASSKDVRVSNETISALSCILNQLKDLTDDCSTGEMSVDDALEVLTFFLDETIPKVGLLALNEKRLAMTATKSFQIISDTPSSRVKAQTTSADSFATYVLSLVLHLNPGNNFLRMKTLMRKLISLLVPDTQPRANRLHGLCGLSQKFLENTGSQASHALHELWIVLADNTFTLFKSGKSNGTIAEPTFTGEELFQIIRILELGVPHLKAESLAQWRLCVEHIGRSISQDHGGVSIIWFLEPLLHAISTSQTEKPEVQMYVDAATCLLQQVFWPQSSDSTVWACAKPRAFTKEKKQLPLVGLPDVCFSLARSSLRASYAHQSSLSADTLRSLLETITSLLITCPSHWKPSALERLQDELAIWFEHSQGDPSGAESSAVSQQVSGGPNDTSAVAKQHQIKHLWRVAAKVIANASDINNELLSQTQRLLIAGLRSRYEWIANDAVLVWNKTFGGIGNLEYTPELASALEKVSVLTEINAIGLLQGSDIKNDQTHAFVESQGPQIQTPPVFAPKNGFSKAFSVINSQRVPGEAQTGQSKDHSSAPPKSSSRLRRSSKSTPKAKLRHDDSQIQFAPIDSSPIVAEDAPQAYLTERQKEVRDRQNGQAAIFPPFQLSHTENAADEPAGLPTFNLKSRGRRSSISKIVEGSSPILPPLEISDGVLGSSPTPTSSRHRSEERSIDDEMPSSPPEISLSFPEDLAPLKTKIISTAATDQPATTAVAAINTLLPNGHSSHSGHTDNIKSGKAKIDVQSTETEVLSDHDIFVDALSEPLEPIDQPAQCPTSRTNHDDEIRCKGPEILPSGERMGRIGLEQGSAPAREVECPLSSAELSLLSAELGMGLFSHKEDTDHEAQLQKDMGAQSEESSSRINKRKRALNDESAGSLTARNGKRRATLPRSDVTALAIARPQEIEADCVLINSRPAEGVFQSVSPEKEPVIKQERAESPMLADNSIAPRASSAPASRKSRRGKNVTNRKTASQGQVPVGRRVRTVHVKKEPEEEDDHGISRPLTRPLRRTSKARDLAPLVTEAATSKAVSPPVTSDDLGQATDTPGAATDAAHGKGLLQDMRSLHSRLRDVSLNAEERDEFLELVFQLGMEAQAAARRAVNA